MRNRHFLLIDALLLAGLPALLLVLRMESFTLPPALAHALLLYSLAALPLRVCVAFGYGLYRCLWRHASITELQRIIKAGATAGVLTFLMGTVGLLAIGEVRLPYSVLLLDAVLSLGVLATPRLLVRFGWRQPRLVSGRRAIVAGAGAAGQTILRETRSNERLHVHVVAFVDDDPHKQDQLLGGVAVVGTLADLPGLIPRLGIDEVIIAMPNARGSVVRRVVQAATDANVPARILPALHDLISGRIKVSALRPVAIEDLLRREPVTTDIAAVRALATDRTVLVTGAGGSIGSELATQIAALAPATLILLDHSENQVFEIHGDLRREFPALRIVPIIADIRDAARLHSIVAAHRPFAVFHAAAHKHVPLMEDNIVEAITNNVLGTRNLVDACLDAETQHLVNISTDKAVRPTSIMGATKRIAEQLVLHAALTEKRNFVSVRFGNVLGSRGSVIPTFLRQIQGGGPITVTHPEMRRYFMTIPEAAQLVLQAGALSSGGELFVLDMGEAVRIADLARDLIRLSGLEEGTDIEIVYTGIRPGEKLYEEVFFGGEDVQATNHPKILRAVGDTVGPELVDRVEMLNRLASSYSSSDQELREAIRVLVPEFARMDARGGAPPRPSPTPSPAISANHQPKPSAST